MYQRPDTSFLQEPWESEGLVKTGKFVDDTFVILDAQYKDEFFNHINSIDENIKFTAETTKVDGSMPFLDGPSTEWS